MGRYRTTSGGGACCRGRSIIASRLLAVSFLGRLMMQADWNYSAKIGTWEQPVAEHVLQGLRKAGLSAAIQPVEPELEL